MTQRLKILEAWAREPTANHRRAAPPAGWRQPDMHRQRPPGTRAPRDKSTSYSPACIRERGSPAGFRSIPWTGAAERQELDLGSRRGRIHHHPAMLVARVQQASSGSIRCPPHPAAMGARIPMRAGRNRLGKPDLPAGMVDQDKTKARPLIRAGDGKIISRERYTRAQRNRARRPGGHATSRRPGVQPKARQQ